MEISASRNFLVRWMARFGLGAKGALYTLFGVLAFMAAFEIGGERNEGVTRNGVLEHIKRWPAGEILLGLLAAGLICYSIWRIIECIHPAHSQGNKWPRRFRYLFSGLTYLLI
jgi:hypothetical protein